MLPTVLFLHRDPVVHQLVAAALADDFELVGALSPADASRLAAEQQPQVVVIDAESAGGDVEALLSQLRARDPHLGAVFFADARHPDKAWRLADLGVVLPRAHDLARLAHAVRSQHRRAQQARDEAARKVAADAQTTQRLPPPSQRADAVSTARISYFGPSEPPPPDESTEGVRRT